MNEQEKIEKLADILDQDVGEIVSDTRLDDLGWDSMGMLSVIALARANGKVVTGSQVREFVTVSDVLKAAF